MDLRSGSHSAPCPLTEEDTESSGQSAPDFGVSGEGEKRPLPPNVYRFDDARRKFRNIPESVIIRVASREWKNSQYELPFPPDHKLIPHGGRGRGREASAGYQIMRKAVCIECVKERTVVAGYINGRKAKVARGEKRNVKVEIIRYILKRRAAVTDARLERVRCDGCVARSESGSAYDYILFDCPPNLFHASKCAIFTSQEHYVPCNPDKLSEIGLALLVRKIERFHNQTAIQQQLIPGYVPAKVRGIILNDVDSKANLDMIIRYMRLTLLGARRNRVVSDDADILSQRIRKAVFAAGVVSSFLPVALTKVNANLKEDYLNLSRYIHNTPLDKRVEANGTERQNHGPHRAARKTSKN